MAYGYTGKILMVNLSNRSLTTIDTAQYRQWGGGHGIGSALFWDLCRDKTVDGLDPRNLITIMTSPMAGTLCPSSSRCELQGIGPQGYPVEWFTRSSFGGRFACQLKYAGWDGIVIEGRADSPVWLNIVDDHVSIEQATGLWGNDTRETQQRIWEMVTGRRQDNGEPNSIDASPKPAVLCIARAGEKLSRMAVLLHDGGNAAGQGGFGGVFGAKNLKAISVLGTGGVSVANPVDLLETWLWHRANFQFNPDRPRHESPKANFHDYFPVNFAPGGSVHLTVTEPSRPHACQSCAMACRRRTATGLGNESNCMPTMWPMYTVYGTEEPVDFVKEWQNTSLDISEAAALNRNRFRVADEVQDYGLNAFELLAGDLYLLKLFNSGVLGPGKSIECDLPFEKWATAEYKEAYIRMVALRQGIGDDLAEGLARAAKRWGRYEEDTASGILNHPNWGYFEHYDPRVEVEWSYGSILGDRDTNDHGGINFSLHKFPEIFELAGIEPVLSAERMVEILSSKVIPYDGDPFMFDYSEGPTGIYSTNRAKTIAWHRHYTRFWTESMGLCDFIWPNFINMNAPDLLGATPEAEPRFLNAITGDRISFLESLEIGRKIWNLDRAIWILQGRHRDMERFSGYVYTVGVGRAHALPVYEQGEWKFSDCLGRTLDRDRFEDWKTRYFELEGWDAMSGWPTRNTLEEMGLAEVADELERQGRLGK